MNGIGIYNDYAVEELKDILQRLSKKDSNWCNKTIGEALDKGWEPPSFEEIKESDEWWEVFQGLKKEYFPLITYSLEDNICLMLGNYAVVAYEFLYMEKWLISHWEL